nr:MAG TPA: integrase [Herelleviridae sp.]
MIIRKIQPKVVAAKKRVAAYCRVSTQRNEQDESFATQKRYYEEMISTHPDWELVKIYSDRHSATAAKNRPGFQEMLADAEAKKLDIVICKSISRFARNIVDCQKYTQWFSTLGITVIFEEQNIRTDDPTSGFVLSMMSAIAQDESHSISENERKSYESRFARGEYNLGNNRILGYDSEDGVLVPNKDAWIVKEVFRRFLAGESYRQIAKGLKEMGAECLHSKRGFGVETLRYMISNETYVGDKCLQKKAPVDYLTKKPDPNRKAMSNYLYDDHEAIIDRETWDKAQAILKERKELAKTGVYKTNREHHFLYGKVFCGECGAPFLRRTFNGSTPYKAWNCRNRQKGKGEIKCGNRFIREEQLLNQIQEELGWSDMDKEQFQKEVSRVLVFANHIEVIKE